MSKTKDVVRDEMEIEVEAEHPVITDTEEKQPDTSGAVDVTGFGEGVLPVNEYDAVIYNPQGEVTRSEVQWYGDKARFALKNDGLFYLGGMAAQMHGVLHPSFVKEDEYVGYVVMKKAKND